MQTIVSSTSPAASITSVDPAANPLKSLEASVADKPARKPRVLPAKSAKPAAKPAKQPAKAAARKPAKGSVKFVAAFTRTFEDLLGTHGYKLAESAKPELVVFAKNGTRVEITNPQRPGGSKTAAWVVTRQGGKSANGAGRDALANELKVPRLSR